MTKQVFEQIAEGLREARATPAAWAIEKAKSAYRIGFQYRPEERLLDSPLILAIANAIAEADKAATERERERLNSMPKSWELSCENDDSSDLSTDLVWKVHAVHGGLNDREWNLRGKGDTPSNAIDAAFIAAAIRGAGHE